MDILRKELNSVYESQNLCTENLDSDILRACRDTMASCVAVDGNCRVLTDAASDSSWICGGSFGELIGISPAMTGIDSSDEDEIYNAIHPEDLVDKRMLEYEFFKFVDTLPPELKTSYKASCRIRIKNKSGNYISAANSTKVLQLSPRGKIWLILCCYDFDDADTGAPGIAPRIFNNATGHCLQPDFAERRSRILTQREKDVLSLIKAGKPSKIIADILGISVHTVNRHRQNILEKLSVGNSLEAVMAASAMKLM